MLGLLLAQVIAVGDFNVAMEPQDVHSVIDYSTAYRWAVRNMCVWTEGPREAGLGRGRGLPRALAGPMR